jgi:hypothetical protein
MSEHPTWQNPRILCILLLVFLCGSMAGAVAMRLGFGRTYRRDPTSWTQEISLDRFKRELNLSADQARQMEVVLNDFVMYYQTLQEQMIEVRASGKNKILQVLNEEQKQKFLHMIDQQTRQAR